MSSARAPRIGVAGVVFDAAGRVLLVERGKPPSMGQWTVPGGSLEPGETIADGVRRELAEETGLEVEVGPLVAVVERMGEDYHFVILDHLAFLRGGSLAAGSDAKAARFCGEAELDALPLTEGLRPVIEEARKRLAELAGAK